MWQSCPDFASGVLFGFVLAYALSAVLAFFAAGFFFPDETEDER